MKTPSAKIIVFFDLLNFEFHSSDVSQRCVTIIIFLENLSIAHGLYCTDIRKKYGDCMDVAHIWSGLFTITVHIILELDVPSLNIRLKYWHFKCHLMAACSGFNSAPQHPDTKSYSDSSGVSWRTT